MRRRDRGALTRRGLGAATFGLALLLAGCGLVTSFDGFVGDGAKAAPAPDGATTDGGAPSPSPAPPVDGSLPDPEPGGSCGTATLSPKRVTELEDGAAWLEPGGALGSSLFAAVVQLSQTHPESRLLAFRDFVGDAIPESAAVVAVRVRILRQATGTVRDEHLTIVDGKNPLSPDLDSSDPWPEQMVEAVYDVRGEQWLGQLTPTTLSSSNFGVDFGAGLLGTFPVGATVDALTIEVDHCPRGR